MPASERANEGESTLRRAMILTPWAGSGDGETDPFRPQAGDAFPEMSWTDVTAQPAECLKPGPNLLAIQAWLPEESLAALAAQAAYFILWDGEP